MPVNAITYQPTTGQLMAAYRPIILIVEATATGGDPEPPFVSCDIYVNDLFYKTIFRTVPETITDVLTTWKFNISDAVQEALAIDIPPILNSSVIQSRHSSAKIFTRFRSSDIDADGFTVDEPMIPVQGTKFTDPVAGTGFQTNSFFAINAALQHEDNQNLETHLNSFKQGAWSSDAYPLTHRNRYFFCADSYDHYPIIFRGDCIDVDLILHYRNKGETIFNSATADSGGAAAPCDPITFEATPTGNSVAVHLDSALAAGEQAVVQYKLQTDSVWIDAGTFTDQDFSFSVPGTDPAGDYDIRVIHFCSACASSAPATGTFTLDGTVLDLAWRGITPFCEQQNLESPIYIVIEERNPTDDGGIYFPNDTLKFSWTETQKVDLYVKFYSDATHLTPLAVTNPSLTIFYKRKVVSDQNFFTREFIQEARLQNTVAPAAVTEILLAAGVNKIITSRTYGPYPTITGDQIDHYTYTPFPTDSVTSGSTGNKGYVTLQQYNTDTDIPTGLTKPNDIGDPDYIAPALDEVSCPAGPNYFRAQYGSALNIAKVEVRYGAGPTFIEAPTVTDTQSGGYVYLEAIPTDQVSSVSVKAHRLSGGAPITVLVNWVDSFGVAQNQTYGIPDNIETTLPATFLNIQSVTV